MHTKHYPQKYQTHTNIWHDQSLHLEK